MERVAGQVVKKWKTEGRSPHRLPLIRMQHFRMQHCRSGNPEKTHLLQKLGIRALIKLLLFNVFTHGIGDEGVNRQPIAHALPNLARGNV